MFYRFAVLDMCDECRVTLLKNDTIVSKYTVHEHGGNSKNSCSVCGAVNAYVMGVLTDYSVPVPLDTAEELVVKLSQKTKRTITEGFSLIYAKDELERLCRK